MAKEAKEATRTASRRKWTAAEGRAALDEWMRSGESELAFARQQGFSRQRLRYWRSRLGAPTKQSAAPPAFVAVAMPIGARAMSKIENTSRRRPPNESLRRLQMELPLMFAPPANDFEGPPAPTEIELEGPPEPPVMELEGPPAPPWLAKKRKRKKRGPKKQHRHGRPKFPVKLPRKENRICVADWQRCCPKCGGRTNSLWSKVSEKLEIEVALYFIRRTMRETVACVDCREYVCTGYIHRQWKRLTAFLRDPKMETTNNEVERDLRRWVLDRKTWYFVGHELSARRAADALTLLTTCRKMGLDPRRYLRATLAKILAGEKDLLVLLPETFARDLAAEKLAAENASTERAAA